MTPAIKTSSLRRTISRDDEGVILIITAILISVLVMLLVFSLSVNEWSHSSTNFRAGSNVAAVGGASTFCSTRACYNEALVNSLRSIRTLQIRGRTSTKAFSDQLTAAIATLTAQATSATSVISGPGGLNEWLLDGVRVRIQRGRWWPLGFSNPANCSDLSSPADNAIAGSLVPQNPLFANVGGTALAEPKFEPFDRFDGVNWQLCDHNKGTPAFVAANAVRVTIDAQNFQPIFSIQGQGGATLLSDTIAARDKNDTNNHSQCAGGFAMPVCALVDDGGEYNPRRDCQFDRYFTDVHRYCTQAQLDAGNCDVLPGSYYGTVTENSCDPATPFYNPQRCQCWQASQLSLSCDYGNNKQPKWIEGWFDPGGALTADRYSAPCSQELGQNSQECTFYPWGRLDETSDHFGVIGSTNSPDLFGQDLNLESTYKYLLTRSCIDTTAASPGVSDLTVYYSAVHMAVGEPFHIKATGLTDSATDTEMWRQITMRPENGIAFDSPNFSRTHPKFFDPDNDFFGPTGFRELGYPWYIGRADDARGFPYGATKLFLDQLIGLGYLQPYKNYGLTDPVTGLPKKAIDPYQCVAQGIKDHGTCGAHRVWYDNNCQRKNHWYVPTGSPQTFTDTDFVQNRNVCWTTPAEDFEYTDTNSGNYTCDNLPPYMPCTKQTFNYYTTDGTIGVPDTSWYQLYDLPAADMEVLHVKLPVIADTSPNAQPCKGVGGSTAPDPQIDPSHDWKIIGFIRSYIFDTDIGKPPPRAPGPSYPAPAPTVCNYETQDVDGNGRPDRYPWQFNPGYVPPAVTNPSGPPQQAGAPANCNMVRARLTCDPGLISGDYKGLATEPMAPPAIVYVN